MSEDGWFPCGVTANDIHEAYGRDCPEDSGLDNEICQGCCAFNDCSRGWPHREDCKCLDCETEMEAERERIEAGQDVFTKESLANSNPLIKQFYDNMDKVFGVVEGREELREPKIKRRDVE